MKNTILDKWCTQQNETIKHYCQICGTQITQKEKQAGEEEKYYCPKHIDLNTPNTLLIDGKLFKTITKTLTKMLKRDNTNQLTFQVARDGAQFRYMDPMHVSLTQIQLHKKAFKAINIDYPTPKTFTINMDKLEEIPAKIEEKDEVKIRLNTENIQITILKNTDKNKADTQNSFLLETFDATVWEAPEPQLNFQAEIQIKTNTLIQALKKIKKQANIENTIFQCTPNTLQIQAHDHNNNKISENLNKTQLPKIQVEKEVNTIYNADYIITLIDALKQYTNIIQIQYAQNTPILLTANLSNTKYTEEHHNHLGHVKFYLAPRILNM